MRRLGNMMVRQRHGAALLETIVALSVLSVSGLAAATLVRESAHALERARIAEAEVRDASVFLGAVSLWTRADLDRRLGERPQGAWRLRVTRSAPTLYQVTLLDSLSDRVLLQMALFRGEERTDGL